MEELRSDNNRLIHNTFLLYIRTFLMMIIGFFTSRVVLTTLGVENYGIINVVGGFVSMFMIISKSLTSTTSRYLAFEIGKKNGDARKVFSISLSIHIILSLILLILFETIGLYILNEILNIPSERIKAANWVYQFSVLSTILSILNAPYMGIIIAKERMSAFAYMSFLDVLLRLAIVYMLYLTSFDKLIVYSFLGFCVGLFTRYIYLYYCRKNFEEAHFYLVKDRATYKNMFSFAGMNFLGTVASILCGQGVNILLNLFFGVTVNAARGVASKVQGLTTSFVGDFTMALKPQITKEYAVGNREKSMDLAFRGSKFSYFLTLLLACPILLRTEYLLNIWLNVYPKEAIIMSHFGIMLTMLTLLSSTLITELLATGDLKKSVWWIAGIRLTAVPLCFLVIRITNSPYSVYYVLLGIEILSIILRLIILQEITTLPFVKCFIKDVIKPLSIVSILSFLITYYCSYFLPQNFIGFICYISLSLLFNIFIIYFIGITKKERKFVKTFIQKRIKKVL